MNCTPETREGLIRVFNNDGPGFRPEIRELGHYEEIADRVIKFIPRSSLVSDVIQSSQD